ncbi:MAG: hypothetical protein AMQ22_01879 [Candidatus Methanofastidiosum methylothiophilum]|uniref:Uncharacterized protein n=1 Tax=Candidatus Methanofastidiosum methylothiophilum TaxID=1705564 RepID=A0A150IUK9_9EURY|nr:MAG: hypothetical protein AMQ22_01879 [Candidatus Methanofastidiosum methylthiophilus]
MPTLVKENDYVVRYGDEKIDLKEVAPNRIWISNNQYFRTPLYNKNEASDGLDSYFPKPDSSGTILLFNQSKTQLGSKGHFITNAESPSQQPTGKYLIVRGLGVEFSPYINRRVLEALKKINYRLIVKKQDNKERVNLPLLNIPVLNSASGNLGENTQANADLVNGKARPVEHPEIKRNEPMLLDDSRVFVFKPNEPYEIYLTPENPDSTSLLPTPDAAVTEPDPAYKFRQYLTVYLFGWESDIKAALQ